MLDTMTITKALGAFCGAFLVLLVGKWVAEVMYHVEDGHHGEQAYSIEVEGAESDTEVAEVEIDFGPIYAAADAGAGEGLWRACGSCHKLEAGANGVGPYLHGVVNRAKGAAQGYAYSDAMANFGGEWTPENLQAFLEDPKGYLPGTKMNYRGMRDVEDRANLIAYLATFN